MALRDDMPRGYKRVPRAFQVIPTRVRGRSWWRCARCRFDNGPGSKRCYGGGGSCGARLLRRRVVRQRLTGDLRLERRLTLAQLSLDKAITVLLAQTYRIKRLRARVSRLESAMRQGEEQRRETARKSLATKARRREATHRDIILREDL